MTKEGSSLDIQFSVEFDVATLNVPVSEQIAGTWQEQTAWITATATSTDLVFTAGSNVGSILCAPQSGSLKW